MQFPIIPAHAMTVHVRRRACHPHLHPPTCTRTRAQWVMRSRQRVQGATLEDDVHILLNAEMFAEGQAYVALSRVRRLSQVHFW